jgi:hypothetical protein
LFGSDFSQNQLKVRRSRVSRNALCRGVSAEGGVGPLTPVIDVALVHADATMSRQAQARRIIRPNFSVCLKAKTAKSPPLAGR